MGILGSHRTVMVDNRDLEILRTMVPRLNGTVNWIPVGSNIRVRSTRTSPENGLFSSYGIDPGAKKLLYFGSLHNHQKGIESAFKAVKRLVDRNINLVFIIAGEMDYHTNGYHRSVRDLAGNLGLEDRIVWTGYLSETDVGDLMAGSDAGIFAFRDGATMRRTSLICAMRYGLPVVTTFHERFTPSFFRHGVNCLMTGIDDDPRMAEYLERLLTSESLRTRIGCSARQAVDGFSWETIARKHIELYEGLFEERTQAS